jgi:Na+/H+ antiporter NhaC
MKSATEEKLSTLSFRGGLLGAILPFLLFVSGVIAVALSGAPDERGFWPILLLSMAIGLILARDKTAFSQVVIEGMAQPIVMIMITAWMLASIIGVLMASTGLVEALTWLASQLQLSGGSFVLAAFIICSLIALSTGSSFATILICGPILYPAGGLLGSPLALLAGAILAGATLGDFIAPISDTTIASALSQQAEIGPTVKSRIKYILPAALLALLAYPVAGLLLEGASVQEQSGLLGSPNGLPMLLVPIYIVYLFLRGKHLLHGLLLGLLAGIVLGLVLGLLPLAELFSLDLENFTAKSLVIDGINRAVGISFFTILLMGLVATLKASGLIDRLVLYAAQSSKNAQQAEAWIAGTVGAAVLLTTHSIVAILMVAEFANRTGEEQGISPKRRANILSMIVCVFPFILPYFIPVILMANTTLSGAEFGIPSVSPLEVGLYNFIAWGILLVAIASIAFGYGRKKDNDKISLL